MKKKKKKVAAVDPADAETTAGAAPTPTGEVSRPAGQNAFGNDEEPEAAPAAAPAAEEAGVSAPADGEDLFADMKKKKKKPKKEIPADLGSEVTPAGVDGLEKKKKSSKKTASDFAKELGEMEDEQQGQGQGQGDDDAQAGAGGEGDGAEEDGGVDGDEEDGEGEDGVGAWVKEGREATYPELLRRFFFLLHQHNPELAGEKRRYTIVPPQVAREGTKKTMFSNLSDICRRMHRHPEHMIQFLYSELGTQGSVDGNGRLIMKGRYTQKQIESVLRKYIVEYVTCKICKSPDTLLSKENRLDFVTCESCGSRRSVSAIKAGYQAQIGKRIKAA
ncbi:putative translation initiation factor [Dioszegia hungarica]|uniref:Translation initiation factor n=1 Tax=Dioszegia hungarica TaxID=4972 RepID=A0AA38GZI8_9TREE|nr:putative translation initiation factor [Dioszegia hungarica]KAI9631743.1 putative translation initiation factor [Dioszegia hungarica]